MSELDSFAGLMHRVRAGEEEAARELVERYEPIIRRVVHLRLVQARLRRHYDDEDICQSVLASFFVRAALGQYQLDRPDHLLRLLATMVRNKLADKSRRRSLEAREDRRVPLDEVADAVLVSVDPSPSKHAALRELVCEAQRRLSPDERQLLDLRARGLEWTEIAARVGGSAEALRKRLARAVDLVAGQLGLDEAPDE